MAVNGLRGHARDLRSLDRYRELPGMVLGKRHRPRRHGAAGERPQSAALSCSRWRWCSCSRSPCCLLPTRCWRRVAPGFKGWIERIGRSLRARPCGLDQVPRCAAGVRKHAGLRFPLFLLVSAAGLLAQTGMFALTAAAVGIEVPFAVWMMLVPLTRIVALVPVSIADFGLIQAAHVTVLALFGVPPSQSFALSALFAIEGLLIHSTAGATAFLLDGRQAAAPPPLRDPASFRLDGPDSVR